MAPGDVEVILHRLGEQDAKLDSIEAQVKQTNGRVTALEQHKAIEQAVAKALVGVSHERQVERRAYLPAILGALIGVLGTIVAVLLHI